MPRPKSILPHYRLHKATGQAVVTLTSPAGSRRDVYLGVYGTDASVIAYGRALIEWKAGSAPSPDSLSVSELLLAFMRHAMTYYGAESKEVTSLRYALKPVRELFGPTPALAFGPKAFKAVRDRMVEAGWCRQIVNRQANRVRRVFRWAVAEGMLPADTIHALKAVPGLARGRITARETVPVQPVADCDVEAKLPYLTPTVAALVTLQRHVGCRPGEAVQLRLADIDRSGPVWLFRPRRHKGHWLGKEKVIAVGPKAQAAVLGVIASGATIDPDERIFSPRRAVAEQSERRRAVRQTPIQPSQVNRRKRKPRKSPGDAYTTASYAKAVRYAIN